MQENPWIASEENINRWSDVRLSVLQATSNSCSAKHDLPHSSQQKVNWTLKMVAAPSFPSNNRFSSWHCFEHHFFLGKLCLDEICWDQGVQWLLTAPFGAQNTLPSFPVCSGWHGQGIFHIWCLHIQRVDLRIFAVEAKLNNFILTFAPIKFSWLLFPTPKC